MGPSIAFLQFCESITTKFVLLAHWPSDITSQAHYMAFIYLGFYLSSKYCPVWVYILIMVGWLYVHFHRDPLCGQCNSLKMFVQELCDVFSSLTASSPGLIYGQRVFSGVDGHFQTGPLGFQLSWPQSESALYRTHAWGHSLPHAPQPRFRSSCYYGQSNPIPLHTYT